MKGLSISGVAKAFGGLSVLSGVDLVVAEGSFTAILGPSGSGKTTLLRIIAGFERPDAGEVRLGGELVDDSAHRFVPSEKRRIGYVPQEGALFPHLSVGRNVAFGLTGHEDHADHDPRHHNNHGHRTNRSHRSSRHDRVDELLELVGLAGLGRRYPHQLSGGQQQRVALARALASQPEIVLLDEPFSSLDASLRASVRADVHDVLRLSGATSILVTHDQDEALSMADQVAILRGGIIAQVNTPSALYRAPRDAELAQFLGEANLVEGRLKGGTVLTALGQLQVAGGGEGGAGVASRNAGGGSGHVQVMIRPEQIVLGHLETDTDRVADTDGVADTADVATTSSLVISYEYFGHDAVVRVRPDNGNLPELVVRITGGNPLAPGARVGLRVHGPVVVWPEAVDEGIDEGIDGSESLRTTPA